MLSTLFWGMNSVGVIVCAYRMTEFPDSSNVPLTSYTASAHNHHWPDEVRSGQVGWLTASCRLFRNHITRPHSIVHITHGAAGAADSPSVLLVPLSRWPLLECEDPPAPASFIPCGPRHGHGGGASLSQRSPVPESGCHQTGWFIPYRPRLTWHRDVTMDYRGRLSKIIILTWIIVFKIRCPIYVTYAMTQCNFKCWPGTFVSLRLLLGESPAVGIKCPSLSPVSVGKPNTYFKRDAVSSINNAVWSGILCDITRGLFFPRVIVVMYRSDRASKSGWGGHDRIAGAGRCLPVSTYYLNFIVLDELWKQLLCLSGGISCF